jgi:hypothetical protein
MLKLRRFCHNPLAKTTLGSRIRVMLVVPLLNSSISILVLCCSCVSFLALNGKYLALVQKFRYCFF